jgi:hypothetical protein
MNTDVWSSAYVRRIGVRTAARYRKLIEHRNSRNLDILRCTEISQQCVALGQQQPNHDASAMSAVAL